MRSEVKVEHGKFRQVAHRAMYGYLASKAVEFALMQTPLPRVRAPVSCREAKESGKGPPRCPSMFLSKTHEHAKWFTN